MLITYFETWCFPVQWCYVLGSVSCFNSRSSVILTLLVIYTGNFVHHVPVQNICILPVSLYFRFTSCVFVWINLRITNKYESQSSNVHVVLQIYKKKKVSKAKEYHMSENVKKERRKSKKVSLLSTCNIICFLLFFNCQKKYIVLCTHEVVMVYSMDWMPDIHLWFCHQIWSLELILNKDVHKICALKSPV